jgi:hypothetical protein
VATPEQTAALAAALRGQRPTTSDMGVYGLVTASDEEDARMQAAAMAQALRGQRAAGNLGLLTGDKVLSQFGQAQLQGAGQQEGMLADAGQFRSSSVLKQALAAREAEAAKAKQAHDDGQRELDRKSREKAAAIQSGDKATQQRLENETGLRKEFNALPEVKEFSDISSSYGNLLGVAGDMSGPGAVATVFNFMKIIDPGVAVMQGDVDLIRNSGGKAAAFANLYDSVLNGNALSESVRKDLLRQATTIFKTRKQKYDALADQYKGIAEDTGVSPGRVVLPRPGAGATRTTPTEGLPTGPDGNPTLDTPAPTTKSSTEIPMLRLKPGQRAADVVPEGERRRVNMGNGQTRTIMKQGGKIVVVEG